MGKILSKNYIYSVCYQVLSVVLPFFTIPYVSRIFGPENLGRYSYYMAIAQFFFMFAMLGLSNYGNREVASCRDDKESLSRIFWEIYAMQIITTILSIIIYVSYFYFFDSENKRLGFLLIIYVSSGFFDISWFYYGLEDFKKTVIRSALIKVLSVFAIFFFVKQKEDLWKYFLIHSLSTLLGAALLWININKYIYFARPSFSRIIVHFKPNALLFIPVLAVSVYKYMDKIMLGSFSMEEAGYYENAEKILTLVLGVITSFGTVMMPRMTYLVGKKDKTEMKETLADSMRFILGLSIALMFGIAAIAPKFVPIFFGNSFNRCVIVLYGLSITIPFSSWANVIRTQCIIPLHHDRIYVYGEFVGAFINFGLNLFLIRQFGAMGAVIGTIAAEAAVTVFQTVCVRKELDVANYIFESVPFILFGVVMFIIVRLASCLFTNEIVSLVVQIGCGIIVYLPLWIGYEQHIKKHKVKMCPGK